MTRQAKVVRPTNTGGHSKVGHKITLVFESCGGATVRPCGQSRQYLQSLHSVANEAETNILGDTSPSPVPLKELKFLLIVFRFLGTGYINSVVRMNNAFTAMG